MTADETTLYLNAKEREALERVLRQLEVNTSLSHDWYFREEMGKDIQTLQDRLDAAIAKARGQAVTQ